MDKLHLMTVFAGVAEEESFAGGARRLAMSPPAVTRCIATLEARLGVKLLDRTTRYVRVTEAGQRYLEDARRIIAEVEEADDAVVGINAEPKGHLTITAPVLFGSMYVTPVVVEYLERYPEMKITALFLDRVVNLIEEGVDVGIRIGALPDSSMKALKVGSVRPVLCASPDYLKKNGLPKHPKELLQHKTIASSIVSPSVEWKFQENNSPLSIRTKPRLIVTTFDAAIEAARCGYGIARQMSYQISRHLASGDLKVVLQKFELAQIPIHVIHREDRHKSARVRTFVDLMSERLRQNDALNENMRLA
jgi:DNA-binding transcriptional LysR family regulator